jgi:hypothetical protein
MFGSLEVNFSIWINFHFGFGNSHLTSIEVELGAVCTNEFPVQNIICVGSLGCERQKISKGFFFIDAQKVFVGTISNRVLRNVFFLRVSTHSCDL